MSRLKNGSGGSPIKVATKINDYKLVINKGANSEIKMNQRFIVYAHGKEVVDPDSKESLGALEIVRGTGRVVHLQESMATIESDMERHVHRSKRLPDAYMKFFGGEETIYETQKIPFEDAEVGDMVKPI